jgi:predicted acetyltransferase
VASTTLRWLTRIVDVPQALAARGYPKDVSGEVHLEIHDDLLPANHGRFLLRVDEGQAEVTAGGRGSLVTDIRGLAPLYSGFLPPRTLQSLGCFKAAARRCGRRPSCSPARSRGWWITFSARCLTWLPGSAAHLTWFSRTSKMCGYSSSRKEKSTTNAR